MNRAHVNQAREVVRRAGQLAVKLSRSEFAHTEKSFANLVTEIDLEVDRQLKRDLGELHPEAAVVSEEHASESIEWENPTWIIDPIDGTTNLIHRYPHFAVSIALVDSGSTNVAIVYDPIADELFHAQRDRGAFLNDSPVRVSRTAALRDSIVAFGIPYDRSRAESMMRTASRVLTECQDIRRAGSSTLDFSYLACGRIDAYFEFDLEAWDHSGGQLLVREAGGTATDWKGSQLLAGIKSDVAASNGGIHEELLCILNNPGVG